MKRGLIVALLVVAGMLLCATAATADVFSNIGPVQQVSGGLFGEYPLGNYALDAHFSAISVGVFSGVDVSGVPPMIAFFLANTVWQLTAFLANSLITVFTWAFSLDLLNGSSGTGGAGALAPVSGAVQSVYGSVFGQPWLLAAIVMVGLWAMWKALVQRRYTETAGALAMSVVFVLVALLIVTQPQRTIGSISGWTNQMSGAFLSLTDKGTLDSEQQTKQADADQLFQVLVYQPWVVLEFGGLEHCVATGTSNSAPVQPLPASASRQLLAGTEITVAGRTCINDANKYAGHFLQYLPASADRDGEYKALQDGNSSEVPSSDPDRADYTLGPADKPATDAAGKGGQYQRLLLAVVILAGELGAFLLLGVLASGVVLAQIVVLVLLGFAPVALVIGVLPGRGHAFFIAWLQRLAAFLLRKATYSLILAVLLAVSTALIDATSSLGWLLSFLLQAAFFWTVFLYRHQLAGDLSRALTGHDPKRDPTARLASLYLASRLLRGRSGSGTPPPPPPPPGNGSPGEPGADGGPSPSGPDSWPSDPEPSSPPAPPDDWAPDEVIDRHLDCGVRPALLGSSSRTADAPVERLALPAPPPNRDEDINGDGPTSPPDHPGSRHLNGPVRRPRLALPTPSNRREDMNGDDPTSPPEDPGASPTIGVPAAVERDEPGGSATKHLAGPSQLASDAAGPDRPPLAGDESQPAGVGHDRRSVHLARQEPPLADRLRADAERLNHERPASDVATPTADTDLSPEEPA